MNINRRPQIKNDSEPLPADDDSLYRPYDPNALLEHEEFWRDHQMWLAEKGYMLRPRFRLDWKPSWKPEDAMPFRHEDGQHNRHADLLDATRLSDNSLVMLKHIDRSVHPHEIEIGQYFSQEPLLSHPKNHCIPILDVLDIPNSENESIIVMPLLREYDNPRLKSVGEAVEYFRQVFEGLQFMHRCHVAHRYNCLSLTPWTCLTSNRDCMNRNIMMDPKPTFPNMYHPSREDRNLNFKGSPKNYTRTARPTKYFLIDFGLSRKYNPEDGEPREIPIRGGDKTVPEFQGRGEFKACNPFPTDIYYLGNMIRKDFLQKTRGVEFMAPLVHDMVQDDPLKRPNIDEVVRRFEELTRDLSSWKLRSRLVQLKEKEYPGLGGVRAIWHFFRTVAHVLMFRNPLPRPRI